MNAESVSFFCVYRRIFYVIKYFDDSCFVPASFELIGMIILASKLKGCRHYKI